METIAGDGHKTTMIMVDLRKLRLALQAKMIGRMITATADIEAVIEMSQVLAGRHTSLGQGSSRSLR